MNFLVCDDEMKIVEQVSTLLQEHCMENGIHAQIHAFDDPCAIKDYDSYDIAFLDIDMEKLNGKSRNRYHFSDELHPVCAGRV